MMPSIGLRELREHTADILRQVHDGQLEYIITDQGQPLALPLPQTRTENPLWTWAQFAAVAESLRQQWPANRPTQALLDDIRA